MLTSLLPLVYQGALSPEQLEIDVGRYDPTDPDPSTCLEATLTLRLPDGEEVTGIATTGAPPGSPVVGTLSLFHAWASGDLPMLGEYSVFAVLTLPGGVYRTAPRSFECVSQFDTRGTARGPCKVSTVIA